MKLPARRVLLYNNDNVSVFYDFASVSCRVEGPVSDRLLS